MRRLSHPHRLLQHRQRLGRVLCVEPRRQPPQHIVLQLAPRGGSSASLRLRSSWAARSAAMLLARTRSAGVAPPAAASPAPAPTTAPHAAPWPRPPRRALRRRRLSRSAASRFASSRELLLRSFSSVDNPASLDLPPPQPLTARAAGAGEPARRQGRASSSAV